MNEADPEKQPESPQERKSLVETIKTSPKWRNWLFFAAGFLAWYIFNGIVWLLIPKDPQGYYLFFAILTLPANLIVLLVLALIRKTRWFAFGMLAAIALNMVIALVLGVFINGLCLIPFFALK